MFQKAFQICLRRKRSYVVTLGGDPLGNLQRIDNALDGIENRLNAAQMELETTYRELETAKAEVQRPFPKEAELQEKSARLQELNSLLNMDERDGAIWPRRQRRKRWKRRCAWPGDQAHRD